MLSIPFLDFILVVFRNFSLRNLIDWIRILTGEAMTRLRVKRHRRRNQNLVGISSPKQSVFGEILFIKYDAFAIQLKLKISKWRVKFTAIKSVVSHFYGKC
jgi:hypothetical protein